MSQLTAWTFTAQSLRGSMEEFATAHLLVFPQQPSWKPALDLSLGSLAGTVTCPQGM